MNSSYHPPIMNPPISIFALLTGLAVAGLLVAERLESRAGVWVAKPLAGAGFVAVGLESGTLDSSFGQWILVGLILCWLGDALLIPAESPAAFRAGIASFLLGHLAYSGAFVRVGIDVAVALGVGLALGVVAIPVLRWLRPHVPTDLTIPVFVYVIVISTMLAAAAGATAQSGCPWFLVGGGLFYLSDLAVARDRFLTPSFWNGAWGLPCYFGAQLVLASTPRFL
jgi:uncharacterized membrane protein YhhN